MEDLLNLSREELEILLDDCNSNISKYKSRLITLVIEKDATRRKIRQLEEEKDILEMVKSGSDFNEHLVAPKPSTMNTLHRRYLKIIQNEPRDEVPKE
jgi:tRNA G10  N-methylase Trm11